MAFAAILALPGLDWALRLDPDAAAGRESRVRCCAQSAPRPLKSAPASPAAGELVRHRAFVPSLGEAVQPAFRRHVRISAGSGAGEWPSRPRRFPELLRRYHRQGRLAVQRRSPVAGILSPFRSLHGGGNAAWKEFLEQRRVWIESMSAHNGVRHRAGEIHDLPGADAGLHCTLRYAFTCGPARGIPARTGTGPDRDRSARASVGRQAHESSLPHDRHALDVTRGPRQATGKS